MPDSFGVYDQLTVREYLQFFGQAYDLDPATVAARVAELLDLVHLSEYADQPVHVLSRGQKQRLALTRALVHRPRVLLLDEPASGRDPRSRIELRDIVRDLAAQGAAVLVSSHILAELEEIADRVVLVAGGRTVGEYAMADLRAQTRRAYRVRALDPEALSRALREHGFAYSTVDGAVELAELTEEQAAQTLAGPARRGHLPARQCRGDRLRLRPRRLPTRRAPVRAEAGGQAGVAVRSGLLGAGSLLVTIHRLRTPTGRLPRGVRVA